LVWVVGVVLVGVTALTLLGGYVRVDRFPAIFYGGLAISFAFAAVVWVLKAATPGAAVFGVMICFDLIIGTSTYRGSIARTALTPLIVLFLLTFLSTRAGKRRKAKVGLSERSRGRSASQIIANLSVTAFCVTPFMDLAVRGWMSHCCPSWTMWALKAMCLAALVEATADTVSSEIGQAFGGRPVMLLSLKRVEVGTDGAVSLLGSGAGILAGAVVAAVGMWGLRLSILEAGIALAAGVCGLFFDSLLGATLERRGWIGNDLVNFSSTVFAAGMAVLIFRVVTFGW
jgi:uncharacterized protein (TIGR00297 family)